MSLAYCADPTPVHAYPGDPTMAWYILRAATRQERRACESLKELKVEHYLPSEIVERDIKRRKVVVERPLFPGYLFANVSDEEFHAVTHATAIHAPVMYTNGAGERSPRAISPVLVETLRAIELTGGFDRTRVPPPREIELGDTLRVTAGPFEGLIGAMLEVRRGDRLALLINGRIAEVDRALLEFAA